MGSIKIGDEVIPDRRNGNGRLRLDMADWIKIMLTVFTTFAVITFGAGKLLTTVSAQSKTIEEHTLKISTVEKNIGIIKSDVSYIRGWVASRDK